MHDMDGQQTLGLPTTSLVMKQLIPLIAVLVTACAHQKPDFSQANPKDRVKWEAAVASYTQLPGLLARCKVASRIEVFEGLPHISFERHELARESKRADTFLNHGFRFYSPAMRLPSADRTKVLSRVIRNSSYEAWLGPKFCGGFHPDLLVRFHLEAGVIDLHLCFGCNEAKFFDGTTLAHVNISTNIADELERVQQACRSKRPAPKSMLPPKSP